MPDTESANAEDPQNAPFELEQSDMYSKYLLHSRTEILFVLRSMIKKNCLTSVYFDQGRSFLLTAILDVDERNRRFILDRGGDEDVNQKALLAPRLLCTANLEKVKIQFLLDGLQSVRHNGRMAFSAKIPETLLRLQRREYFRLETPQVNPILCQLKTKNENGVPLTHELPLLDISGGGVCLMVPTSAEGLFPVGVTFTDARIELPEEGVIQTDLEVRNNFLITMRNGNQHLRVGCRFIDLPGNRLTMIQRYITRIERERKARLSGLE